MKKTIIAMLALSGVAFGATVAELNTNLGSIITNEGYTAGDNYTLSFTFNGDSGGSQNILTITPDWNLRHQMAMYLGITPDGDPTGNLTADRKQPAYGVTLEAGVTDKWLYEGASAGSLNGAVVTLEHSSLGTTLSFMVGEIPVVYASITGGVDLSGVKFADLAPADAELILGGTTYDIASYVAPTPETPAVPEPTTATLSLLALAGLAARRRRK